MSKVKKHRPHSEPVQKLEPRDCSRGTPMGTRNITEAPSDFDGVLHLALLPMDGDYCRQSHTYWGCNSHKHGSMYRAYYFGYNPETEADEEIDMYIRATSRDEAKQAVLDVFPNAHFYR